MSVFSQLSQQLSRFIVSRRLFAVFIAVQLPMTVRYFVELWPRQHYQFFPFAVITFVVLFATRKAEQPEQWNWLTKILLGLDLACMLAGCVLFSPWFFAVGLLCCLIAWCLASQDDGYQRSLLYLAVLPLVTIRLPLNYDALVIMWLQRVTTAVTSGILHRTGILHYREGNVLNFPGKSFLVEEACSGVQSLFTILFLAAFVFCLKRRSFIHGFCLLSFGVILSGMMNILRVVVIAVAWDLDATDLSKGWPHDALGYLCLGLAAAMLMSADQLLEFLFDPMLDVRRHGRASLYFNPLIAAWNKALAVLPVADSRFALIQSPQLLDRGVTEVEHREDAPVTALVSPLLWFQFSLGGMESWFFSRPGSCLFAGLPFATLMVVGTSLVMWQRNSSIDSTLVQYEDAFNAAIESEDVARQETYLRSLASLRPSEPSYRFRLAEFMLRHGRATDGVNQIMALAPENRPGYAEAHFWLATQAMQPMPVVKLSRELVEHHVKSVLALSARDLRAHVMLAQLYAERKEWKLAERSLSEAATIDPEHYLALAKLRKQLNRDPQDVSRATQLALEHLMKQLSADRSNVRTRIAVAEALVLAEQDSQARELLLAGLQQKDDPQLRRALNELDLLLVERRLKDSGLNRDAVVPVALQALERDPSHLPAVQMLTRLRAMGASFPVDSLKPAIEHWQQAVEKSPDSVGARVLLGELLLAAGDDAKAIEVLSPAAEKQPELRLDLARLKSKNGSSEEAAQLLESLIAEARAKLAETPDDVSASSKLAQALIAAGRLSEVRDHLARFARAPEVSPIPEPPELAALYGQACVAEFDHLTGYQGDPRSASLREFSAGQTNRAEAVQLLELLDKAYACAATANQAIDRLSRLSLSTHPAAGDAEEMLRQLRLEGTHGANVLNLLGMHALMMDRFDKAKGWLEQANLQTRGRDPMILNNLATAIVRGGGDSNERALKLANETLALLPDHPDALSTRGEVYVAMERWPEAIADLTQSLQHRARSAELHRLLEKAYLGLQDAQMAAEHRKRAEELEASVVVP